MPSVEQKLASEQDEREPEVYQEVEVLVAEIIDLANLNVLDLACSRRVEMEVPDHNERATSMKKGRLGHGCLGY